MIVGIKEDLDIMGRLTLSKYAPGGPPPEEVRVKNSITLAGRTLVSRLFNNLNSGTVIQRVSTIRVGGGGDAFDAAQTALTQPVASIPIRSIEQLEHKDAAGGQRVMLRLTGELTEAEGNGELHEAGLFTEEGVMYNRVTFDTISKSIQFRLKLVWEIIF